MNFGDTGWEGKRDYAAEARALPEHNFDLLMHDYMWRTFKPRLDGVSALELGCFHGAMTGRIYAEFPDTTVVEASAECVAIAKGKWPLVEFFHTNFEGAHLGDRQFDAIFLIHTLEHVDDPVGLLEKCRQWLEPGGHLFIAVPNAFAASRQIAVKMGLVEYPDAVTPAEKAHGHKRTYSLEMLLQDCHRAGLFVEERGGILFKALANHQMDLALKEGVITPAYLDACYELGKQFPGLCASVYAICRRGA